MSRAIYFSLSHRPTAGRSFAWGRVPMFEVCVGIDTKARCCMGTRTEVRIQRDSTSSFAWGWIRRSNFTWGQINIEKYLIETFSMGMEKIQVPMHPLVIFLRGDAWGNAWGGFAWVSETGVSSRCTSMNT